MKKGIAILLYLFLMAAFFGFDFLRLFNIKQMVFVILGAIFLYLPHFLEQKQEGNRQDFDGELFGQNALWASLIEFFILIFTTLSSNEKLEYLTPKLAFACRPVLYGFCLWLVFQGWKKEKNKAPLEENTVNEEKDKTEEITFEGTAGKEAEEKDTQNTVSKLKEFGLTKRELEVANLILKDFSNAEIAAELYISETTVKKHVTNIFGKMGIKARGELKKKL